VALLKEIAFLILRRNASIPLDLLTKIVDLISCGDAVIPLDESLEMRLGINLVVIETEAKKLWEGDSIIEYWATALTLLWVKWVSPVEGSGSHVQQS
jgi:hypothetical protein